MNSSHLFEGFQSLNFGKLTFLKKVNIKGRLYMCVASGSLVRLVYHNGERAGQ